MTVKDLEIIARDLGCEIESSASSELLYATAPQSCVWRWDGQGGQVAIIYNRGAKGLFPDSAGFLRSGMRAKRAARGGRTQ